MVDFMAGRRSQIGQSSPAVRTFDLEGALRAQAQSSAKTARNQAQKPRAGSAMERALAGLGPDLADGEDSKSIWDKALGFVTDVSTGRGTVGKLTAPINPWAQYRIFKEDVPGGAKAETAALHGIDMGKRASVLALDEASARTPDWLQEAMMYNPLTVMQAAYAKYGHDEEASAGRSVGERLADPRYGFGDITKSTGNQLADNVIGFVGDVALDPASYVTLGSTKFAGAAGRIAAANRLAKANTAAEAAGRALPFAQEGIERVAKYGVSHADDAMRAQLKLGDDGIRFMGGRVPGTGKVADVTGKALSEARAEIMQSNIGKTVSWMRSDKALKHSLDIIAGRVDGNVDEALAFFGSNDVKRAVSGRVLMETRDEVLGKELRGMKGAGRIAATHALEAGVETTEAAVRTRAIFDTLFNLAQAAGTTGMKRRANYVPHHLTRTGKAALQGVEKVTKRTTHKVNTAQSRGASYSRQFKAGDYWVPDPAQGGKHVKVTLKDASIQEINEKIGGVTGVKIFEDDLGIILERSIREASQEIGISAQLQSLQKTHPQFVRAYNEVMADHRVPDTMDKQLWKGSTKTRPNLHTDPTDPANLATKAQRANARRRAKTVQDAVDSGWDTDVNSAFMKAASSGRLGPHVEVLVDDGFDKIVSQMRAVGQEVLATPQTRESFERVARAAEDPAFGRVLAAYMDFTRLFKGYATMTPGFHLRNGMSAMFMNLSDGVRLKDHLDAYSLINKIKKGGKAALDDLTPEEQMALQIAVGSGVHGGLSQTEVRVSQSGRGGIDALTDRGGAAARVGGALNALDENALTRLHKDFGTMSVEGPMRLAVGLNTVKRAVADGDAIDGLLSEGLARVTRLHFDYSQASHLDTVAKSVIPFWTFMSRNLPLQVQQQFQRPRAYAKYAALRDNFDLSEEGDMPSWLTATGSAMVGGGWHVAPDMPFANMKGDSESFRSFQGIMQSVNPIFKTPYELSTGRKTFLDREFREDENKWMYALSSLLPPLARANQLSGGNLTNLADGDRDVSFDAVKSGNSALGMLGIPVKYRDPDELRRQAVAEQLRALNAENGN